MKEYKYYAFISYKREDQEWAKWLQNKLEYFKLPVNSNSPSNEEGYIRPVFRDITDLRPGCLPERIREALDESKFLIAVCSPRYSKSKWCDEEVRYFIETGRIKNVIPFIIDGKPYSDDEECFPPSLSELRGTENELLGADIRTLSNEYALVQIVATMFGIEVDSIWKRYLKDEEEAKRKLKEQNDHLLSLQSRITASKAQDLIENWPYDEKTAGKLVLEVLPKNLDSLDRPWVTDAEYVLRRILHKNHLIQSIRFPEKTFPIDYCQEYVATIQPHDETILNRETNQLEIRSIMPDYSIGIFHHVNNNWEFEYGLPFPRFGVIWKAKFSSNNHYLAFLSTKGLYILDIRSKEIIWKSTKTIESEPNRDTLKWSPDYRYLVCNNNQLIEVVNLENNQETTINGHSQNIISLSFDKSGQYLVSIGFEREIKIWDLYNDCKEIYNYQCPWFSSFAGYDSLLQELYIVMDSSVGSRLTKDINNINKQGSNILRKINIRNNRFEDIVLQDSNTYYIKNMQQIREYEMILVDCDSSINVFDSKTGLKIDQYMDAFKLHLDVNAKILSFVKQNVIETYKIPSKKELISHAQKEFGSIELSDDVKYKYFIQ